MTAPTSRLTPERITALRAAWTAFTVHRRHVWTVAPLIERRFYRSQDAQRHVADHAQLTIRINAALRSLTAAARRICGRDAQVSPLGATRAGMASCFLVRVPNGLVVPDELVLGAPHRDDEEGLALMARREHAQLSDRAREAAGARQAAHHDHMVQALTEARTHLALKARVHVQIRLEHGHVHGSPPDALTQLRRQAYFHHARAARCMARAVAHKNKLARLGLAYDLASISTTVVLPEEGASNGESQQPQSPAPG